MLARRVLLREQDDLPRVQREVLDHVVDRVEHRHFAPLDRKAQREITGRESGDDRIRRIERRAQRGEQCRRIGAFGRGKFRGAIALVGYAAHAAHDPLPDVALEMQQQIADAVRAGVRASPERVGRQRLQAVLDLRRVLGREIVARLGDEFGGDVHWHVSQRLFVRSSRSVKVGSLSPHQIAAKRSAAQTSIAAYDASARGTPTRWRRKYVLVPAIAALA